VHFAQKNEKISTQVNEKRDVCRGKRPVVAKVRKCLPGEY